jgi:TonB-dependent SusC/RagA subfamily outer membrane receptor
MKWIRLFSLLFSVFLMQSVAAQNPEKKSDKPVTISGKVMNQDNMPIAGAVFYIDNVKTGYITKDNGSYKIKVSPYAVKLKVLSSEYGSAEILIAGQKKINFTLVTEVQVSKTGGHGNEASLTNSNNKAVKPRSKKMNTYNDIYQMVRGEVPGIIVSGKNIQIQQGHSFLGSSTPLFVVNGVIVPSIDNINPVEVRSISVLKGSAASIYGVNGSNGVLCITLINGSDR